MGGQAKGSMASTGARNTIALALSVVLSFAALGARATTAGATVREPQATALPGMPPPTLYPLEPCPSSISGNNDYCWTALAKTGQKVTVGSQTPTIASLGQYPGVNDLGTAAFVAQTTAPKGSAVMTANNADDKLVVNPSTATSGNITIPGGVSIDDNFEVVASDQFTDGTSTVFKHLNLYNADPGYFSVPPGSFAPSTTELARSANPPQAGFPYTDLSAWPSINDVKPTSTAARGKGYVAVGAQTDALGTQLIGGPAAGSLTQLKADYPLRPQIAAANGSSVSTADAAVRMNTPGGPQIQLLSITGGLTTSNVVACSTGCDNSGFTALGDNPAVTADESVVVFTGSGSAGNGLFAAIRSGPTTFRLQRLVALGAGLPFDHIDTSVAADGNGVSGGSLQVTSTLATQHAFTVAFRATTGGAAPAVYTVRVRAGNVGQVFNPSDPGTPITVDAPVRVLGAGDTVAGLGALSEISLYQGLDGHDRGDVVVWAAAGAAQAIIKARPRAPISGGGSPDAAGVVSAQANDYVNQYAAGALWGLPAGTGGVPGGASAGATALTTVINRARMWQGNGADAAFSVRTIDQLTRHSPTDSGFDPALGYERILKPLNRTWARYYFHGSSTAEPSQNAIDAALKLGHFVVAGTHFGSADATASATSSNPVGSFSNGHVIVLDGLTPQGDYIVDDPAGDWAYEPVQTSTDQHYGDPRTAGHFTVYPRAAITAYLQDYAGTPPHPTNGLWFYDIDPTKGIDPPYLSISGQMPAGAAPYAMWLTDNAGHASGYLKTGTQSAIAGTELLRSAEASDDPAAPWNPTATQLAPESVTITSPPSGLTLHVLGIATTSSYDVSIANTDSTTLALLNKTGTLAAGQQVDIPIDGLASLPLVSIAPSTQSIAQGAPGTTTPVPFSLTLSASATAASTVDWQTVGGDASLLDPAAGEIVIPPGATGANFSVKIKGSNTYGPTQTFAVHLRSATNLSISNSTATVNVTNTNPKPTISVGPSAVTASPTATVIAQVPISLTNPSATAITAHFATADGSAHAVTDYQATSGTVNVPPHATTATIPVTILPGAAEPSGSAAFSVKISAPQGANLGTKSGTVTITANNPPAAPTVTATAGTGAIALKWKVPASQSPISKYTIYRSTISGSEALLTNVNASKTKYSDKAVTPGTTYYYEVTATNGAGEGARSSEVSATPSSTNGAPGPPTATVTTGNRVLHVSWTVPSSGSPISGYTVYRGITSGAESLLTTVSGSTTSFDDTTVTNGTPYYYVVTATNATGEGARSTEKSAVPATLASAPTLTAMADNAQVHLRWEAPSSSGGASITGYVILRSTASNSEQPFASVDASTFAFDDPGRVNDTQYFYEVRATTAAGDGALSSEQKATPSTAAPPAFYVPNTTVTAPLTTGPLSFTVSLSAPAAQTVTVHLATSLGTAKPGTDYGALPNPSTLTFPAGDTSESTNITIVHPSAYKGAITFNLNLSAPTGGAVVARTSGVVTILTGTAPTLSIGDVSTNQNQTAIAFPVTLSASSGVDASVQYTTVDGSAKAGQDYTTTTGTLTIPAGQTTGSISVPILNHSIASASISLQVAISNPQNATIVRDIANGTIVGSGVSACQLSADNRDTWTGTSGDGKWGTPGNWSTGAVPGASDNACIPSGTSVTLDSPQTVGSVETDSPLTITSHLQLASPTQKSTFAADVTLSGPSGAELDVTGTLEIASGTLSWGEFGGNVDFSWSSTIGGAGTIIIKTGANMSVGAGLCAGKTNPDAQDYTSGCASLTPTVQNAGHFTIANGRLFRDSTAPIVNTGTITLDDDLADSLGSSSLVGGCESLNGDQCTEFELDNNAGAVLTRAAGPNGSVLVQTHLTNLGTVHLAGNLAIDTKNLTEALTGTWSVDAGAKLEFDEPTSHYTLDNAATIGGAGTLDVEGPSIDLVGTMSLPGLKVGGGTATIEHDLSLTTLTVTGGTIAGPGSIDLSGTTASGTLSGGTIANDGNFTVDDGVTLAWTGGGMSGNGTTDIGIGATLSMVAGTSRAQSRAIVNQGTTNFSAGGVSATGGSFTNYGSMYVAYSAQFNNPIWFDSTGGFTFENAGFLRKTGTTTVEIDGFNNDAGCTVEIDTGTLLLRSSKGVTQSLDGTATVASGATLLLDKFWTAGDPGSFVVPTTGSITGAGTMAVGILGSESVDVDVQGTFGLPSLTVNGATTAFDEDTSSITHLNVAAGTLSGTATVTLQSGATATIAGAVGGALNLTAANGSSVSWGIAGGGGGTMSGTGTTTISSGATLTIPNTSGGRSQSRPIVNNGTITWAGSSINATTGASVTNNNAINASGAGTWADATNGNGFQFANSTNATITKTGTGTVEIDGYTGGAGKLNINGGTLTLAPTRTITATLTGGASVASGSTLDFEIVPSTPGGLGAFQLPAAATMTGAGNLTTNATTELAGTFSLAALKVNGFTTTLDTNTSLANLNIAGGTLTGPSTATVTLPSGATGTITGTLGGALNLTAASGSAVTWSGPMTGAGTTTISSGATLTIPTAGNRFQSRPLVNNGTINWTGSGATGGIEATGGSVTNNGTINISGTGSTWEDATTGNGFQFANAAHAAVTQTSTGTTEIDGYTGGAGALNINSGTLVLRPIRPTADIPAATLTGGATIASGADLDFETVPGVGGGLGAFQLPATAAMTGAGKLSINATTELAGTMALPSLTINGATTTLEKNATLSTLTINAGTLTGASTATVTLPSGATGTITGTLGGALNLTAASGSAVTWTGPMSGAGTTTISSGATLTLPASGNRFQSRAIVNNGTINVTTNGATGGVSASAGSVTNNGTVNLSGSGLTWSDTSAGTAFQFSNTAGATITNTGTNNEIDGYTGGAGTINANLNSGTLILRPTRTIIASLTGGATIASGANLDLEPVPADSTDDGRFLLPAAATLTGAGNLTTNETTELAGTYGLASLTVNRFTTTLDTNTSLANLNISGGTLTGPSTATVTLPSGATGTITGTLGGALNLTAASGSTVAWSGPMSGAGTTTIGSGATLNLPASGNRFQSRALVNNGTINVTTSGATGGVSASSGSVINNGTINLSGSNVPWADSSSGTAFQFSNALGATIANTGTNNEIDGYTGGAGALNVTSGTLLLRPTRTITATLTGGATIASGATLDLELVPADPGGHGAFQLPAAATLTGAGTFTTNAPTELAGTVTVANVTNTRALAIDTSHLAVTTYTQSSGASLTLDAASATSYGEINATGAVTLAGTLKFLIDSPYVPVVPTTYNVIASTTGAVTGTFSTFTPPGSGYTIAYSTTAVQIQKSAAGRPHEF